MTRQVKSKKAKRKIMIESFFVFFIAITPFLYKLYDYLPEDPDATVSFLGIVIGNNGFADVSTFMWFMMSKIIPLYLLLFWFLTSKNWWYHIILIPMAMYAFQIFEVLYSHDSDIDTENIFWLLPVCMVVIPFVYFVRVKLYDKYVHGIDLEAMEAEISILREKQGKRTKEESTVASTKTPEEIEYKSLSEKIDQKLSTSNIESVFRQLQHQLSNWLHLRF